MSPLDSTDDAEGTPTPPHPPSPAPADPARIDAAAADHPAAASANSEPAASPTGEAAASSPTGEPVVSSADSEPVVSSPNGRPPASRQPAGTIRDAGNRAGRNLPAALAVGGALAAAVLASLLLWRPAFLGIIVAAVAAAIWELARAVRGSGIHAPLPPLLAGGVAMPVVAWFWGTDGLALALLVTALLVMVWRLSGGPAGYLRDVSAGALIAVYLPFLAGFAAMLAAADDGHWRVLAMLGVVVLSDTGGYVAGVFLGRRPLAPTISPKKSWEGLAGSLLAAAVGGGIGLSLLFGVDWWWGAVFGLVVAGASVLGDLVESLLKRDLGVKDMSGLLPGHGGVMDRADSILFAAPTAYLLLVALAA